MILDVDIRRATPVDCRDVFEWRNDRETQAQSLTQDPISWDSHCAWYASTISDPFRWLLIGEHARQPVGVVRFDELESGDFRVSITVAPACRGKRMSAALLHSALRFIAGFRADAYAVAEVRDGNDRSLRLFRRCGFTETGRGEGLVYFRRVLDISKL